MSVAGVVPQRLLGYVAVGEALPRSFHPEAGRLEAILRAALPAGGRPLGPGWLAAEPASGPNGHYRPSGRPSRYRLGG